MIGQLNEHPLAELVREISAAGLSGALRLSRERAKSVLYFDSGEIVYSVSNIRAYRLAECIKRWGALPQEQVAQLPVQGPDLDFASALVSSGAMTQNSLDELMGHQVADILCHALLWTEGEWEFDPRVRIPVDVRGKIKPKELLMEAARRLPPEFIASRLTNRDLKLSPVDNPPGDLKLSQPEAFLMTRAYQPLTLEELLSASGLSEPDGLRAVYTLLMGGLVSVDEWPQALTAEALAKAHALKTELPKRATGELKPQKKAPEPEPAPPAPPEPVDEKAALEELFERLRIATNQYQILGVVRPAGDADIKRAYHSLAKRFHPDRFRRDPDPTLHTRVEAAFARIAQAYETLKDSRSRATYDAKLLQRGEEVPTAQPTSPANGAGGAAKTASPSASSPFANKAQPSEESFHAEERFKQGLTALHDGNITLAIACLSEASRLDPSQPRYRAYYGRALSRDQRLRHSAEAEMKAAVTLDERNATYRIMLAELYVEIGLPRRARGELERALAIDPRNETARRMLDKLRNGG